MTTLDGPFLSSRNQGHYADVVALLSVAGLLIGAHLWLPNALLSRFVFRYGNPNLVTAWTAATIHDSTAHLVSNLAWYGFVIGPAYTLYANWDRRRLFWLLYGGLLVITPLTTVAVDYWLLYQRWGLVGPESVAFGFSGVVSAFGGLLIVGLAGVSAEWYSWRISIATTVACVASGVVGAFYESSVLAVPRPVVLAGGVAVVIGFVLFRQYGEPSTRRWVSTHKDAIILFGGCGVVVSGLVAAMFSVEAISAGRFMNVIAHGTGFVTGVIAAGTGLSLT